MLGPVTSRDGGCAGIVMGGGRFLVSSIGDNSTPGDISRVKARSKYSKRECMVVELSVCVRGSPREVGVGLLACLLANNQCRRYSAYNNTIDITPSQVITDDAGSQLGLCRRGE
jgi:hypothetical protein